MTKNILVVDDDLDILSILTFVFESREYRVRKARSGTEALQIVSKFVPDLFILDISLPGMDGLEICRRLRSQARTRHVPVLFLTARDQPEMVVQGFEAGGDDYVVKPFNMQELVARVENLLRRSLEVAPPEAAREGKVISVTSARGGVGKTTLAINLALCLTRMWTDDVLLVDSSLEFGRAAVLLDMQDTRGLEPLLLEDGQDLDRDYLDETYMTTHPSGLHFLDSPSSPGEVDTIGMEDVDRLLRLLRSAYGYTVFDLDSSAREPYRSMLRLSDQVIVVVNPEVPTLIATQSFLHVLAMLDISTEAMLIVLNDYPRVENSPSQEEIEALLGLPLANVVPAQPTLLASAANAGRPPILEREEAPFNQAIIQTTYYLTTNLRMR
jgi:pilus assembly protein CpaE